LQEEKHSLVSKPTNPPTCGESSYFDTLNAYDDIPMAKTWSLHKLINHSNLCYLVLLTTTTKVDLIIISIFITMIVLQQ